MKDKSITHKLNIIKGQGSFLYNFNQYLLKNDGSGYYGFYNFIKGRKEGAQLLSGCLIKSYEDLWDFNIYNIPKLTLEKNLIWNFILIKNNISLINDFIKDKKILENLLFNGQFDKAIDLLDQIDENYSCSFWGIEIRLLIEKLSGISCKILNLNNPAKVMTDLFKIKVDVREKGDRYKRKITDFISRSELKEDISTYIRYKMGIGFTLDVKSAQAILYFESNSIIDIFLTTQNLILNFNKVLTTNKYLNNVFNEVTELIDDKAFRYFGDIVFERKVERLKKYSKILNHFENNDWGKFITEFCANKKEYISNIHLLYLYCISLIMDGVSYREIDDNGGVSDKVLKKVFLYLTDDSITGDNDLQELDTLCRIFDCCYFGAELKYLFNRFFNPEYINSFSIMNNEDTVELMEYYSNSSNNLINVYYSNRNEFTKEMLQRPLVANIDSLSYNAKNYVEMIKTYMFYYFYLKNSNYEEALNILIQKFVIGSEVVCCLDITDINEWIKTKRYEQEISVQKLIYINTVETFRDQRTSAFLNFLETYNIYEPLKILDKEEIDLEYKKYFLDKICNIENLASIYSLFVKSDEVEDYRINICKTLMTLNDGEARNKLEEEINVIYRQRNKRQKLSKLDEGKLSVDFEAVNETTKGKIAELFNLYKNTPEDEYELCESASLLSNEIQKLINKLGNFYVTNYVTKRSSIIKEMYEIYLKDFCFGKNGLDIYLSTRIRHGAFSNQIQKVFSAHSITKERFLFVEGEKSTQLLNIFQKIENIINDIIQNKLKVNYENAESSAIFNYYEADFSFYEELSKKINETCNSSEKCLMVFEDVIMEKTNKFLDSIKEDLLVKTKNNFSQTLDEILSKAKEVINEEDYNDALEKSINDCNVELKEVIEKISGWFVISRDRSWPDFSFNELLELCGEIGKSLHLNFEDAEIHTNVDIDFNIKGKFFKDLNDIFVILQNNAFTHSGFTNNKKSLKINIDVHVDDNSQIKICFRNNLNINALDIKTIDDNILKVNTYFAKANYTDSHLHKEGGTGLLRTINILFSILKIGEKFVVNRNKDEFEVHIVLNKEELINEESIVD